MSDVLIEIEGLKIYSYDNVCYLEFGNAKSNNAIGTDLARQLAKLTQQSTAEPSLLQKFIDLNNLGLVALRSSLNGIFVSGGDLRDLGRCTKQDADIFTSEMRTFCKAMRNLTVPSLSVLSGAAFGGGAELALATDSRWCLSSDAALHFWQAKWAVPGGWYGMTRLQEIVPAWDARKVGILFAQNASLNCEDLVRFGIADRDLRQSNRGGFSLESELSSVAQSFLKTPRDLRLGLVRRGESHLKLSDGSLEGYDETLFAQHWMGSDHRARLEDFNSKKKR